jgi:hypothetical protein
VWFECGFVNGVWYQVMNNSNRILSIARNKVVKASVDVDEGRGNEPHIAKLLKSEFETKRKIRYATWLCGIWKRTKNGHVEFNLQIDGVIGKCSFKMPDGDFAFKLLFIRSYDDPNVVNPCLDYGSVVNVLWIHDVLRD